MIRKPKALLLIMLSALLAAGIMVAGGCVGKEPAAAPPEGQIIEDISTQEAYDMIQRNQNNPDFIIIDVRTPEEFDEGHLEDAVNIDFYSDMFAGDLSSLNKGKAYLIYCRSGGRSGNTLNIMEDEGFLEVYNIVGGIIAWQEDGLPTTLEVTLESARDITPRTAYRLLLENPEAVILDVSSADSYAEEHIAGAINISYNSDTFTDQILELDKSLTYITYCRCLGRGIAGSSADVMAGLDFADSRSIYGGLDAWKDAELPTE